MKKCHVSIVKPAGTSRMISQPLTTILGLAFAAWAAAPSVGVAMTIIPTYEGSVPAAATNAFNSLVKMYDSTFVNNMTVNIDITFAGNGLGGSADLFNYIAYTNWVSDLKATSALYPNNTCLSSGINSLTATDPIGNGFLYVQSADAMAIGVPASQIITNFNVGGNGAGYNATLTFGTNINFNFTGSPSTNQFDFLTTASHELNEALGIGSLLTGQANNTDAAFGGTNNSFLPQDFYRYGTNMNHLITTVSNASVFFSYNGGKTLVAQFNQDNNAGGNTSADRNDWIYGNNGPPTGTNILVQNAVGYPGQAAPLLNASPTTPEFQVLSTLGYSVPEPTTVALLGLALVGGVFWERGRRGV